MDGLGDFLEAVHRQGLATGHLRGLFHIAIGRRITRADGTLVSAGVTWRELAALLKEARYNKDLGTEVGADPNELSPRDRQRFWYSVIALARPDSAEAVRQADQLASSLKRLGYVIGPGPVLKETAAPEPGKKPVRKKVEPPPRKKK